MTFKPLISILVPCFNQGKYLNNTFQSIVKQNYSNWECVIVNDGSTDETEVIAKRWCKTNPKFSYYHKDNAGISSARNLCLKKAKGDYLQWLDGDDFLAPNKLRISIDALEDSTNVGKNLVISNFKLFNQEKKVFEPPYCNLRLNLFNYRTVLYDWEDGFTIPIHCGFFNTSLLNKFSFPEEVTSKEDWLMWVYIFQQEPEVFFIDEPLAIYRRHAKSMTRSTNMTEGHIAALDFLKIFLSEKEYEKFARHTMVRYYKSSLFYRKKYHATKKSNTYRLGNLLKRAVKKVGLLKPFGSIFHYLQLHKL